MKRVLLPLLMLMLAACTNSQLGKLNNSEDTSAIIGGKDVESGSFVASSTVAVLAENDDGDLVTLCSGVLISNDLVLTAAHCIPDDAALYVSFGVRLPESWDEELVVPVDSAIANKDFEVIAPKDGEEMASTINDLAVLKLSEVAPEGFAPAPILSSKMKIELGRTAVVAGFGIADEKSNSTKNVMQYAEVKVLKQVNQFIVTDQTGGSGACKGDSGGPAYMESPKGPVLVGVTRGSHGGVNDCHHYAEFTFVPSFKNFLLKAAKSLEASEPQFLMY